MIDRTIRALVRGAYDIQKIRIQYGNRLVANFRAKLGIKPGTKESLSSRETQELLLRIRRSYDSITQGAADFPEHEGFEVEGDQLISSYAELCLVKHWLEMVDFEKDNFKRLGQILNLHPLYSKFLVGVRGIDVRMSGVLISEIDIHTARYPSSLWKYAGLDVAPDGKGRSRKKEHLIRIKYIDKHGKEQERDSITFNPFLKTKLISVLGPGLIRAKNERYYGIYQNYKHRLENHAVYGLEKRPGHRHAMAVHYMVKMFLIDLYNNWKVMEGLKPEPPYHEAKLGKFHANPSSAQSHTDLPQDIGDDLKTIVLSNGQCYCPICDNITSFPEADEITDVPRVCEECGSQFDAEAQM